MSLFSTKPAHPLYNVICADHQITELIKAGVIKATEPLKKLQLQPASLDLRLGRRAWRLRASFLPGQNRPVEECLSIFHIHEIDLTHGSVLEPGAIYLAEIMEHLTLPSSLEAIANPKSSVGRLDIFTRLISDYSSAFDHIQAGYNGRLFIEIAPRTFPILLRTGSTLAQIRFREFQDFPHPPLDPLDLRVSLSGFTKNGLIGYRARRYTDLIDFDQLSAYKPETFWEALYTHQHRHLILDPGEFYLLASQEAVSVPPTHAAYMAPFDPLMGEFRIHYAGFFDPGFGTNGDESRAVLEVRSRDVPFVLEDGQMVGKLIYEPMSALPTNLYGKDIHSHYQGQSLKLSKHFLSEY